MDFGGAIQIDCTVSFYDYRLNFFGSKYHIKYQFDVNRIMIKKMNKSLSEKNYLFIFIFIHKGADLRQSVHHEVEPVFF